MKFLTKVLAMVALLALSGTAVRGETEKPSTNKVHKVVFEVAVAGLENWEGTLRNIENVQKSLGAKTTQIELVSHGKGIGMLLTKTSAENPQMKLTIEKLHASGVVFAVCENTMKRMRVLKDQLLPLATTVDSGVSEVIRKQEAGYAYIKSGG